MVISTVPQTISLGCVVSRIVFVTIIFTQFQCHTLCTINLVYETTISYQNVLLCHKMEAGYSENCHLLVSVSLLLIQLYY